MYTRLSPFVTRLMNNSKLMRVLGIVILWLISASFLLTNLGYPRAIVFDETYLIPRAQRYMQGIFFQESHPPLGRLIIALGQWIVHPNERHSDFALVEKTNQPWDKDQDMTGYRLIPALVGTFIPILIFLILLKVLPAENKLLAFLIGVIVIFDNALLVQSRFALSDSMLIVFVLASILIFVQLCDIESNPLDRSHRGLWALWGITIACAALVKFSALFVLVLVPIYIRWLVHINWRELLMFGSIFSLAFIVTTVTVWQVHFSLIPKLDPSNTYEISQVHRDILKNKGQRINIFSKFVIQYVDAMKFISRYHEGVPKFDINKPGEIGSPWYQWPFGGRAINYRWETPDGITFRYIYMMGNPVVWLISLVGVVGGTAVTISDALFRFLPADRRRWLYIFSFLYWAYMTPMMFIERVMYLYHYLPPLLVGIILFSLVFTETPRLPAWVKRESHIFLLVLAIIGFWIYKPLTYYEPLTNEQFEQRNVWPAWDLRCAKCENDSEK
jgi:dolichyl-phosphate-mannose-protein mannosyltransferase